MAKKTTIGVDVGGTKIRAGLVSPDGKILKSVKLPTDTAGGEAAVMTNIIKSIVDVWDKEVSAIGLGLAGIVDHRKGIYLSGPNFPKAFRDVSIVELLKKRFGVPVAVDNDVHCFTLAEARLGAGSKYRNVVGITLGTGIGGGIVIDGKLYRGRNNAAGELGHMTIGFDLMFKCGCGRNGHFEAMASGTAVSNVYYKTSGIRTDAISIEKAALMGDAKAIEALALMGDALSVGLANVIHILNPDVIVVGGGLSAVEIVWKQVMKKLDGLLIYPALADTPVVRPVLGTDANVLGASFLVEDPKK